MKKYSRKSAPGQRATMARTALALLLSVSLVPIPNVEAGFFSSNRNEKESRGLSAVQLKKAQAHAETTVARLNTTNGFQVPMKLNRPLSLKLEQKSNHVLPQDDQTLLDKTAVQQELDQANVEIPGVVILKEYTTVRVQTPKRDDSGYIVGDSDKDGLLDEGETWVYSFVDQKTFSLTMSWYQVINGEQVLVKSIKQSWACDQNGNAIKDENASGYSYQMATMLYQYDSKGRLIGATGTTEGRTNVEVFTPKRVDGFIVGDTDRDGVKDEGETWEFERVDQKTYSKTVNQFEIVNGKAVVKSSMTDLWACDASGKPITDPNAHGYSHQRTTLLYKYDAEGQLVGAVGMTEGLTNVKELTPNRVDGVIVGDVDKDGVKDEGETWVYEWVDQKTYTKTINQYQIVNGKALVSKSFIESWACDATGKPITDPNAHGYEYSITETSFRYNANGQLVGYVGETLTRTNARLYTPKRVDGVIVGDVDRDGVKDEGETWVYEWVNQKTESVTRNVYVVVMGQALVARSETESWACDAAGNRITDPNANGYAYSVTETSFRYNANGQLVGAVGETLTRTNARVYTPKRVDGVIVGDMDQDGVLDEGETWAYEWVSQKTETLTRNEYVMILGQAVVARSVTESRALRADGRRLNEGDHGYAYSVTKMEYRYNANGQLIGMSGMTKSLTNVEVLTPKRVGGVIVGDVDRDGVKDAGETWAYEWVDQKTETQTKNEYVMVLGQAVVTRSVTESWACEATGKPITDPNANGYAYSVTKMEYRYSANGQLIGMSGMTKSLTNVEVLTPKRVGGVIVGDVDRDGVKDEAENWVYEWVDQKTETLTKNVYVVVLGQALVSNSKTESWACDSTGKPITDPNANGYAYSITKTDYRYNAKGQLIGASGTSEGWTTVRVLAPKRQDGFIVGDVDRDGVKDKGEVWVYEWASRKTYTQTESQHVVILGCPLVSKSVTESWACDKTGKPITNPNDPGYLHFKIITQYKYDALGRLLAVAVERIAQIQPILPIRTPPAIYPIAIK